MNVALTEESRRFIAAEVSSGRYASEDEVVETALRRMRDQERPAQPAGELDDDPLWGIFRDEPELVDQIVREALRDREAVPLRMAKKAS